MCATSAGDQVARLVANLTPATGRGPSQADWAAVRGLLSQSETLKLTLPDDLEKLGAAAAELERRLASVSVDA
jgi:hypothetical protein